MRHYLDMSILIKTSIHPPTAFTVTTALTTFSTSSEWSHPTVFFQKFTWNLLSQIFFWIWNIWNGQIRQSYGTFLVQHTVQWSNNPGLVCLWKSLGKMQRCDVWKLISDSKKINKDQVSVVSTSTGIRAQQAKLTGRCLKQTRGCGSLTHAQLGWGAPCCRMLWVLHRHKGKRNSSKRN